MLDLFKNYWKLLCLFLLFSVVVSGIKEIFKSCNRVSEPDAMSYQKACNEQDFETAHLILNSIHNNYCSTIAKLPTDFIWDDDEKELQLIQDSYFSAHDYVYKQEIMFLISNKDNRSSERIVYLLQEIPIDGVCPHKGIISYSKLDKDHREFHLLVAYTKAVDHFNKICSVALDLAIAQKNRELAEKLLMMYKKTVEVFKGSEAPDGTKIEGGDGYIIFHNVDKQDAIERFNEAFQESYDDYNDEDLDNAEFEE